MESNVDEITRKKMVVIAAGFGLFVLVIIIIWMLSGVNWRGSRVTTLNRNDVINEDNGLSQQDVARAEEIVGNVINMYYKDKIPDSKKATVSIRKGTADDGTTKMLIDVDEIRVTFELGANSLINCAEIEDSKYNDGMCIVPEGRTTLGMIFGGNLPVRSSIEQSEIGYSEGYGSRSIEKDKKKCSLTVVKGGNDWPQLMIYPDTCDENDKYIESVKKYITWLDTGWSVDMFDFKVAAGADCTREEIIESRKAENG